MADLFRNDLPFKVDVTLVIYLKHLNGEEGQMAPEHCAMPVDFVSTNTYILPYEINSSIIMYLFQIMPSWHVNSKKIVA